MKKLFLKSSILTLLWVFLSSAAMAAPEARELDRAPKKFGDYEVSFAAFPSTFLSPDIARAFKLKRGPKTGLVNIAVRNIKNSNTGTAVKASLDKSMSVNLLGQMAALDFKEIDEGDDAIYYLADFRFSHEEVIRFNITVKPEGSNRSHSFKFRQQFYEDGK